MIQLALWKIFMHENGKEGSHATQQHRFVIKKNTRYHMLCGLWHVGLEEINLHPKIVKHASSSLSLYPKIFHEL